MLRCSKGEQHGLQEETPETAETVTMEKLAEWSGTLKTMDNSMQVSSNLTFLPELSPLAPREHTGVSF